MTLSCELFTQLPSQGITDGDCPDKDQRKHHHIRVPVRHRLEIEQDAGQKDSDCENQNPQVEWYGCDVVSHCCPRFFGFVSTYFFPVEVMRTMFEVHCGKDAKLPRCVFPFLYGNRIQTRVNYSAPVNSLSNSHDRIGPYFPRRFDSVSNCERFKRVECHSIP